MARPNFQDIVPPDRRSIKKIPVPERRRTVEVLVQPSQPKPLSPEPPVRAEIVSKQPISRRVEFQDIPKEKATSFSWSRIILTCIALVIILGVGFWFVSRAQGAQITITPKHQDISVDSQFTALNSGTGLQFQTITIEKVGKLGVPSSGQQLVNDKASGTIVIYNTTKSTQTLVANTRFQSSKGLIFRIAQAVTIPSANGTTPGSVEATITADQAGPNYNVGLDDFTIPGFAGDQKFKEFYGRSKSGIVGGFSGMKDAVSDADIKSAQDKINTELQSALLAEAEKDIPSGYVMPKNAFFIEFESLPQGTTTTGIEINDQATFHGFIFKQDALAQLIATKANGVATTDPVTLYSGDNLFFTLITPLATSSSPWDASSIVFSLKGTTTLVSSIDTDVLKNDLEGKPRKNLNAILAGYPSVANASVIMRPFWKSTFPTNKDEITISILK